VKPLKSTKVKPQKSTKVEERISKHCRFVPFTARVCASLWRSSDCWVLDTEERRSDTRCSKHQADDCLGVLDLATSDHLERVCDRHANNVENLIFVKKLFAFGKLSGEIDPHLLLAKARRDKEFRKLLETRGAESELFLELTGRAGIRSFALVKSARRNFQKITNSGMPVLP
jgi:hypothetical protein